jgi:hypothetical protein
MTTLPRQRRLPAATAPATAVFCAFEYRFSVATRSPLAVGFLERLYGSPLRNASGLACERYDLGRPEGGPPHNWEVCRGGERLAAAPSLGAALNALEYHLCLRQIETNPHLIALHGATVLTDRGAAFLSGPSGAGKTTLSLALAARGYRVGGDDVALFDPRTHTLVPVARCFHLDARSRRLLRNEGLIMPARALRHAFLTPMDLGKGAVPASPLRLLLFLGRAEGQKPRLTTLNQAEMMARLLSETPWGTRSAPALMAALKPMVCSATSYHLLRGRLSTTAETVAGLLGPA